MIAHLIEPVASGVRTKVFFYREKIGKLLPKCSDFQVKGIALAEWVMNAHLIEPIASGVRTKVFFYRKE